jgi:hypothetical protein
MIENLSPIGDYSKPKIKGYYFDINEWVGKFHNIVNNVKIDPREYFITSGEAVIKGSVLENDLWDNYKFLYRHYHIEGNKEKEILDCLNECWKCSLQSTSLTINLIEARGINLFLETDWHNGLIICYPKNPRGIKL